MTALRSRLSLAVLALLFGIVILPAIALFIAGAAISEASLREVVDDQVKLSLGATEKRLSEAFYDILELSARMVEDREIRRVLSTPGDEIERTRALDRAVSALLLFFPYREDIRFTVIDPRDRIFTNWSRNLEDYSFLPHLPLAKRAFAEGGHAVWEGFAPSYIREDARAGALYVTIARTFPDFGSEAGHEPLLLLGLSAQAVGKMMTETSAGPKSLVLLTATGAPEAGIAARGGKGLAGEDEKALLSAARSTGGTESFFLKLASNRYVGSSMTVSRIPQELKELGWRLTAAYEFGEVAGGLSSLSRALLAALALLLVASLAFTAVISRSFVRPVVELARRMDSWRLDDSSDVPARIPRADEIGTLERSFSGMGEKIRELFASVRREHEIREVYRIKALRGRLNPHFLFNSLNTIRFMAIIRKAGNIVEAVDAIGTMLQYAMSREGYETTLAEELRNIESYLLIQNARFGGRFALVRDIEEGLLDAAIPRFALQPAVENSVVHGYRDSFGSGEIRVEARVTEGTLKLKVIDRGRGMEPERLAGLFDSMAAGVGSGEEEQESGGQDLGADKAGGGLGLPLVREMVRAGCGEGFDVLVTSEPGQGTTVEYILPLVREAGR